MEAGDVGRAAGDRVELLRAVDAGELAVLGDVHAHTHDIVLSEHVLVVTRGVLPLIEECVRSLHRVLGGAVGTPLVTEILTVVVGNVLARVGRITTIKLARTEVLVVGVMIEVVRVGHMLAPRTRIRGHSVGNNQLRQTSIRAVSVHLLNDECFNDARLGGIVDLRPVNPVEAAIGRGRRCGSGIASRGSGLERRLLSGLEGSLSISQSCTKLSLTRRIGGRNRGVARSCSGIAGEQRVIFCSDATFRTGQRVAECVLGRRRPLSEGRDHNEGCRNCRGGKNHRGMGASELERHWLPAYHYETKTGKSFHAVR